MGAGYGNIFDVNDGILIATDNFSPAADAASNNVAKAVWTQHLPQPNNWSDLMYLQYSGMCVNRGLQPGGLTHVFQVRIRNDHTQSAIDNALNGRRPTSWSIRVSFTPTLANGVQTADNAAFYSLLYSPNARGLGWLLLQHKYQMGLRYIDQIAV